MCAILLARKQDETKFRWKAVCFVLSLAGKTACVSRFFYFQLRTILERPRGML